MNNNIDVTVKVECRIKGRYCGKCCYNTEMILTVEDLYRIIDLGYSLREFAVESKGFIRLRNIDGHCVFLDPKTNKCMIYEYRPIGCRLYPLIYDPDRRRVLIDRFCPKAYSINKDLLLKSYRGVFEKIIKSAYMAVHLYRKLFI